MRKTKLFSVIAIAVAALAFIAGAPAEKMNSGEFIEHVVTRGESVSLICIELYGHYTDEMASVFLADNPRIKDINLITIGQTLRFHNPHYAQPSSTAKPSLFTRSVVATQGVVTYVEGRADFADTKGKRQTLVANTIVGPGDTIITGADGRVELIVNAETVVRVAENTTLAIDALRDNLNNKGATAMKFSLGAIWTKMKKFGDGVSRFRLQMPTAVAGVHGTVYQAIVDEDTSCTVNVYNGEVAVTGWRTGGVTAGEGAHEVQGVHEIQGPQEIPGPHEVPRTEWERIVKTMQQISIDKNGVPSDAKSFRNSPNDSWERWNIERDKRIERIFMEQ